VPEQTSRRAKAALATLVAGYFAMAVVAGAPNSPLTVLLPNGAAPPTWARSLANAAGLADVGRRGLTALAWVLLLVVLASFAVVVLEAWSKRIRLGAVLIAAAWSLLIAVAGPLLLSRDVYTYAAYGRIEALYGGNPYLTNLSAFPHDRFVAATSLQWLHTRSHYGPVFTLASAGLARAWAGSVAGTILAFKALAGVSITAATGLVALTARKIRPERAALAAGLVGLNPVVVVHTVGGGHVDALLAAPLAGGCALVVTRPPGKSARAFAITALITLACLIKTVMLPVLLLWLAWLARPRAVRALALHLLLVAALVVATAAAFFSASHPSAPLASFGGIESWASPSHFVARGAQTVVAAIAGAHAGHDTRVVAEAAFLLLFAVLLWRLVRRVSAADSRAPIEEWGIALLLLALSLPYLLPWYAAWFVPFLAFFEDAALTFAGVFACVVLAFTLVPADPFHGLTTPAVMDGVHYGAAPVLLLVLVVIVARLRPPAGEAPNVIAGRSGSWRPSSQADHVGKARRSLRRISATRANAPLRRYPVGRDGRAFALQHELFPPRIGEGDRDLAVGLLVDDDLPVTRARR
jgi:alpha-1,6-mannosyltransferase